MSITVDPSLANQLGTATGPIELRTADGRLLGLFMPQAHAPEPNISDEELRLREDIRTGQWFTAAEVETKLREWRKCSP